MVQFDISEKYKRKIKAIKKNRTREVLINYFVSFSFLYMLLFAGIHYFKDDDALFINTFGVVIIDVVASLIYYILLIKQIGRNQINICYENKKKTQPFPVSLIDKNLGENGTISAFKMIIFIIVLILLSIYCLISVYYLSKAPFMSINNALDFVMFFISIAYFDLFWEGGIKKLSFNFRRVLYLTSEDNFFIKTIFFSLLSIVAMYQLYTFIIDCSAIVKL